MKKFFLFGVFIAATLCFSFFYNTARAVVTCHGGDGVCKFTCDNTEHSVGTCAPGNHVCCVDANPDSSSCTTSSGPAGLKTAIGCIDTFNPTNFITNILGLAVGIGGGIAFLLMLFGTFQIMASGGDPKSIQAGKETITSALTGLLLIIFSVFLLRLIGMDILGIPGL
ncbi:hypothetical protein COT44_03560 [Candidatus Shapirobacteria bacterium CG08_land_8_20_14_0_20_39_18]|uniref:Uncharacterized protein n=1 Tax=Candidatus Shapirobacteria bacterium CG08_land_8_20_14_0_20_39_18 TaxID=1974883 RepID=A0A2M6XCY6_9BACT|nr:MAG: hypothetical protein COT44_03560 [Candidatus Shapirobacteria bacterium CG08_land_8_20_14_0_20_39_18]PJE67995.1 MAG: hypothetical protein COU94_04105 [Candidatus Shapirobacteria bacterium CG10_big_fil_rev_8_21_14_0_10_38_8]